MTTMTIIRGEEHIKAAEPWTFTEENVPEAHDLQENMHETVMENQLLFLTHQQVGGTKKVLCIRSLGCMFNPRIVHTTPQEDYADEASPSIPGLVVKIKRPFGIRVRYQIADGTTHTEGYNGLTARAIQCGIDHLNGELFYKRASRLHRDQAFRKHKKFVRAQK